MSTLAQWLVVAVVVAACAVYATWTLLPASLRRTVAAAALNVPLPAPIAKRVRRMATSAPSCGCSGCDQGTPAQRDDEASAARPITLHRRLPG